MATRARMRLLTLDEIVAAARRLTPRDRLRLIERLAADLEPSLPDEPPDRALARPTLAPSLYGLWKGLVPEMSAEEITELRREAWAGLGSREI